MSRTIRGIPTEVVLDEDDGMPQRSALGFDSITYMPKSLCRYPLPEPRRIPPPGGEVSGAMSLYRSARLLRVIPAALLLATASPPAGASDNATYRTAPHLRPAGDLDGDGLPDLISVERRTPLVPDTVLNGYTARDAFVTARRGFDGQVLWERQMNARSAGAMPLGPAGDGGILVAQGPFATDLGEHWGSSESSEGILVEDSRDMRPLSLTALDRSGQTTWSVTYENGGAVRARARTPDTDTRIQVARSYPRYIGALQATASPARDALVTVTDREELGGSPTTRVVVSVLDGADGRVVTGRTFDTTDVLPEARTAGDLDGDGLDDFLVLHHPTEWGLSAFRGSDAGPLWTVPEAILPQRYLRLDSMGDLNSDGIAELEVQGSEGPNVFDTRHVWRLLDGATGALLREGNERYVSPIGDLDEDDRSELLVQEIESWQPEVAVTYRIESLQGEKLAERVHAVPAPADDQYDWAKISVLGDAGNLDADEDGIPDSGHAFSFHYGNEVATGGVTVQVPSLEALFAGEVGRPLHASLDGAGEDLVLSEIAGETLRVRAQDGADGTFLWTRSLDLGPGDWSMELSTLDPLDVDGDGVPDIVLGAMLNDGQPASTLNWSVRSWVLRGTDGALLWSA